MSTREIQGHLEEMYGVEVGPALISEVTDAVIEELREQYLHKLFYTTTVQLHFQYTMM
jgi:transposase-like protein